MIKEKKGNTIIDLENNLEYNQVVEKKVQIHHEARMLSRSKSKSKNLNLYVDRINCSSTLKDEQSGESDDIILGPLSKPKIDT